jgi:hypothetical protein
MTAGTAIDRRPQDEVFLGPVTACQGCFRRDLRRVYSFQPQPPVQAFLTAQQLNAPETAYPLDLIRCSACGLVQIGFVPPPEIVFPRSYPYQTGMTRVLRENFRELTRSAKARLGLRDGDLAIDIGSNDGTLLKGFRDDGLRVLGVEPTDIAKIANSSGIPTLQAFFDEDVAREIVREHGRAAVVAATNVIAHTNNLYPMLRGIRALLDDGGTFVSESHYLISLVDQLQYDTIYHEHLRYYSLRPLIEIHERAGFSVTDVQRVPTHGGSIRVWATTRPDAPRSRAVDDLLAEEERSGLYGDGVWEDFGRRLIKSKHDLQRLLLDLRQKGDRIVGVGAPARSSMLLGVSHIDPDLVSYVVEPTGSLKIGLFTPGTRIPIVDEQRVFDERPEWLLLLSWHIADELMPRLREKGHRGGFVTPLPAPRAIPPASAR